MQLSGSDTPMQATDLHPDVADRLNRNDELQRQLALSLDEERRGERPIPFSQVRGSATRKRRRRSA